MIADGLQAIGGLGAFLLGMVIMTEGLRSLAGEHLSRWLFRWTKSPVRGAAGGALTTAVFQSSSATAVATVGFVSAGVLEFSRALGILFGANIGTTITGWIVALVGFKLKLGSAMQPLLLIGVLMLLLGSPRIRRVGKTLAGLSLVFFGLENLKEGMQVFEGLVTPDSFPDATLWGQFALVGIGIVITLVTQSSSAGVAAALVAMHSGTITFPQAAAMVIGMDVGTTFTAVLATIGGSVAMRRTGWSHVVYNSMTAILALCLLPLYSAVVGRWFPLDQPGTGEFALVGFHTAFNVIGVLAVLPFTGHFASLMNRIVSERRDGPMRHLDRRLLKDPGAACRALSAALEELTCDVFHAVAHGVDGRDEFEEKLQSVEESAAAVLHFARRIHTEETLDGVHEGHVATLRALDHLQRLIRRSQQENRRVHVHGDEVLRPTALRLARVLHVAAPNVDHPELQDGEALHQFRRDLNTQRRAMRDDTLRDLAAGRIVADAAQGRLDGIRWLFRATDHASHVLEQLAACQSAAAPHGEAKELEAEAIHAGTE